MTNFELSIQFFLQLALILLVCRAVGLMAKRAGQPQVVCEMIAGVMLGPSLLGYFFPVIQNNLFPPASMSILFTVSQLGLVLYMFVIGLGFDVNLIRRQFSGAAKISLAGIIAPFLLGGLFAFTISRDETFFSPGITNWEAALFMGAAMSITAFPMLARIIYERGLTGTRLGTLALAAGSMDDAAAWCILAVVLSSFGKSPAIAIWAIGGGIFYVLIVWKCRKILFDKIAQNVERKNSLSGEMMAAVLILLMLGAWFTDFVGIYAVFGAFILGIFMPRGLLTESLTKRIEPLTTSLLLPLFFIYSGLNTKIGLVNTPVLWGYAILVILIACAGKGIACYFAARQSGLDNNESASIATLMNARGLMELIILNIGLERGLITPTLFTIMVIMAIFTTLAATPVFNLVSSWTSKIYVMPEGEGNPSV